MEDLGERLDVLLTEYESRKQDETQRQVQRALRLEQARKVGVENLRKYVIPPARDVTEHLEVAGHRVVYHEFLETYPPSVRIHLWPRHGPMDEGEARRTTLELVWGEPTADALCVTRWSEGLHRMQQQGSAPANTLDDLWVKEQLLEFVRETLEGS